MDNLYISKRIQKILTALLLSGMLISALGVVNLPVALAQHNFTSKPYEIAPILPPAENEVIPPILETTELPYRDPNAPQGANCSSPVVFDDQWSNGFRLVCQNNLYVLMVDLTNPAVKVEVKAAPSGNHTLDWYADSNTIAVINADYQYSPCPSGAICSNGLTISNGSSPTNYTNLDKLCNDGYVRREIGFTQDQRPVIDWWYKFVSDSQARSWCDSRNKDHLPLPGQGGGLEQYSYNLVGAGPQFTFDGSFKWECGDGSRNQNCPGTDVVINGEHFKPGDWWNRYQSAIGYSSDGTTLVLAESNNATHTMQAVHDLMYQRLSAYGKTLKNAFKFDGGSIAGFWYYNSTYHSTPNVNVPSVVRIQRTNSTCYSLSTNVNPGESGNVSINTPSNCAQGKYLPGTSVQLSANPNSGYSFNNWSGDISGSSNPTNVTMNGNKNVTANFSQNTVCYSLNKSVSPSGSGTVNTSPDPNCNNGTQYTSGTSVQLTASANSGYNFSSWSGDASGTSNPTMIIMSGNKNVTANFSINDGTWIREFGYIAGGWRVDRHPRVMGDVNGDGKEDIVGFGDNAVYVSLSTGTSFGPLVLAYREFGYIAGGWRVEQHPRMVADVNGDGKVDLVGFGNAAVWVALNTSTGSTISFGTMTKWINEFGYIAGGWRVDRHPRTLADINGDGKADVIGFGDAGVYVALSNGSSFGTIQKWSNEFGYISGGWRVEQHPRLVADMNQDGKADLVGFGNSYVYVALSNGSGFGTSSKWLNEFGYVAGGWRVERHPRTNYLNTPYCGALAGFGETGVYLSDSYCTNSFYPLYKVVSGSFGSSASAGGWMVDRHPRMMADVDGNGVGDIIGFGNAGVYVVRLYHSAADLEKSDGLGEYFGNGLTPR